MTTLPPDANNEGGTPGAADPSGGQVPPQQPPAAPPPPPAAPQQPMGQQPQVPPHQPGGYQQPQAPQQPGAYQQPAGGYQQPQQGGDPANMVTLNYWLSVFFTWLPALIFYFIEKDKGNQLATAYHRENLNFSLVRTIVYVATVIINFIPYIGWIIGILLWIASVVLFVFHIIAAAKATNNFRQGQAPEFIFNLPMVK